MFLKSNKFLYYLGIGLCLWGAFTFYKKQLALMKKENALKPKVETEVRSIEIDMGDLGKSLKQAEEALQNLQTQQKKPVQENVIEGPAFSLMFTYTESEPNKNVMLCRSLNSALLNVRLFSENLGKIYENPRFNLENATESADFYKELQKALLLSTKGERFEIFIRKFADLPSFMLKNPSDASESGLFNVAIMDVTEKNPFNPVKIGVTNFKSIGQKDFKFHCGQEVRLSYKLYSADGKLQKEFDEKFRISMPPEGFISIKQDVLEYLILNSADGEIDAIVPSDLFLNFEEKNVEKLKQRPSKPEKKVKKEGLILKGKIYKDNEK